MALMNVYDKLVMGPDAGNLEGAIEKKWFKNLPTKLKLRLNRIDN